MWCLTKKEKRFFAFALIRENIEGSRNKDPTVNMKLLSLLMIITILLIIINIHENS